MKLLEFIHLCNLISQKGTCVTELFYLIVKVFTFDQYVKMQYFEECSCTIKYKPYEKDFAFYIMYYFIWISMYSYA